MERGTETERGPRGPRGLRGRAKGAQRERTQMEGTRRERGGGSAQREKGSARMDVPL